MAPTVSILINDLSVFVRPCLFHDNVTKPTDVIFYMKALKNFICDINYVKLTPEVIKSQIIKTSR